MREIGPQGTHTAQLAALQSCSDGILVADGATGSVDEPCALLEVREQLSVDETAGSLVEGAVDGDDIALEEESDRVRCKASAILTCETNSFKSSTRRALTSLAASDLARSVKLNLSEKLTLTFRERSVVVVEKLLAVERLQSLEDTEANTASTDSADDLALKIVRIARNLGHLPVAALDHLRIAGQKPISTAPSVSRATGGTRM